MKSWNDCFVGRLGAHSARLLELVYFAAAAFFIFVLPYRISIRREIFAYSYDFGFNNKIAIASAVILLFLAPFFLWRDREFTPAEYERDTAPAPRYLLYLMVALHTVGIAFYYLLTLLDFDTPDGSYFLSKLISMSQGLRPYRDFEFAYGPALLYPAHWLNSLGLSVHAAYFVFYLVISYLGIWITWRFVNRLSISARSRTPIFLLICSVSLIALMTVGVSYTCMRFVTPLWILGMLNEANLQGKDVLRQVTIAIAGILLSDLISPEIGTVLAFSAAGFFGLTALRNRVAGGRRVGAAIACISVHGLFFFVLMPPEFRSSILTFSAGGNNFPVAPGPIDLLYLLCFAWCMRRYARSIWQCDLAFPLLLLYALGSAAGALAHADSGHIAWNGIAVFALAIVGTAKRPLSVWLIALLPAIVMFWSGPAKLDIAKLRVAIRSVNGLADKAGAERLLIDTGRILHVNIQRPIQRLRRSSTAYEISRKNELEEVEFLQRFPSVVMMQSTDYVLQERLAKENLKPLYFFGLTNAFAVRDVSLAVDSLKRANAVVLVERNFTLATICPSERVEQTELRHYLQFPYIPHRKHDSCEIYLPYYTYVLTHYKPAPDHPGIWVRNDLAMSNASLNDLASP